MANTAFNHVGLAWDCWSYITHKKHEIVHNEHLQRNKLLHSFLQRMNFENSQ
jgi:hypothetical protein